MASQSKKFPLTWTKNKEDPEGIRNELNTFVHSRLGRLLIEILDQQYSELESFEIKKEVYDLPSWPYRQAHINGQKCQIKKLKDLFTYSEE